MYNKTASARYRTAWGKNGNAMYRALTVIAFVISAVWLATAPGFEPAVACVVSVAAVLRDDFCTCAGSGADF